MLFDEAYVEFLEKELQPDSLEIVKRFPNVIVPEPSLRLMVWPAAASVTALLSRSCLSLLTVYAIRSSVNDLSQLAAIAALEDQEFLETTLKKQ